MSLNQKYTWKDFLEENPELKAKKVKRTSGEGKKAFEAAFKTKMKEVLKDRLAWIEKETTRANKKKESVTADLKASKKSVTKKKLQSRIGSVDKYLSRLEKSSGQTKQVQKSI